jgi:hypothetical protein
MAVKQGIICPLMSNDVLRYCNDHCEWNIKDGSHSMCAMNSVAKNLSLLKKSKQINE